MSAAIVRAETVDSFLVRNIVEDIRDENLVQARNRALLSAQRDAYQTLMQRLTAQSEWGHLPKIDDAGLQDLVQDVGIDQERVGPSRITAILSVHFKPDSVRRLLRGASIAYAEWRGRPLVILPLWQTESGVTYLEGANPWRDLWRQGGQGLVPVTLLPANDLLEGVAISALAQPSDEVLTALAQKANAADLLIVVASPGKGETGLPKLDLTLSGQGPLASQLSGQKGYGAESGESPEQLLQRAAIDLARSVDENWKGANLLQYDKQGSLLVMAPLGSFEEWLAIRDKLTRSTAVRAYDLAALSRSEAVLTLHYVGDQAQLESVLMQNGLVLTSEDQNWTLRVAGGRLR